MSVSTALAFLGAIGVPWIYTEAPRYVPEGGERFPAGAVLWIASGDSRRLLAPGFAASADATVSYDGKTALFAGKRKPEERWQIWEVAVAGGVPRRVIAAAGDTIRPLYLPGGRIVYALKTAQGFQLETARNDGSGALRLTYAPGDHLTCDVLRDGRVLFEAPHPSGRELYTVYTDGSGVEAHRCDHGGVRGAGRELSSGDIVFQSAGRLWRFTSARAMAVEVPAPPGEFAGPVAETSGAWLVAYRAGPRQPFAVYALAGGRTEPAACGKGAHALQPVVVQARPVPRRHPSALGDRAGANVLCLNVYASRLPVREGSVAAVRVWSGDTALGQAPVEHDGSFFVQVPTERPIRFELLDRGGTTVAAERGSFWLRRGEQRVCVGCHAGPERAPENVTPAVLLHSPEPVRMRGVR